MYDSTVRSEAMSTPPPPPAGPEILGTRLRTLLHLLEADVAAV